MHDYYNLRRGYLSIHGHVISLYFYPFPHPLTGTGKTYTMLGNTDEHGIMSRALDDLLLAVDTTIGMKHEITMSYLEVRCMSSIHLCYS